jgi:hypothetical protein
MEIRNARRAGLAGWLSRAHYWSSPEGRLRKELRRLDKFAASRRDMTPRLAKKVSREANS